MMRGFGQLQVFGLLIAFVLGFMLAPRDKERIGEGAKFQLIVMPGLVAGNVMEHPTAVKINTETGQSWFLTPPFADGWHEIN